ncbi:adenylate cyclase [Virgibacillus profundi]|uniref:Adenylate cyclase n=1 Tax=Virgibacillus profundi TaxID=2024555 RepID=A0A2A2IDH2_9BACI|nr:CYTH domain-containing protein [Virgibacillus profundi]PAV29180.1 adenylate cyclase [Virgibacillus profundi]PXY53349.1 CYTH domain-containing protein [Virgibacillus profundi]
MTQEIEIEYKNLLTKEEFNRLLYNLPFPEYSETQTNYYFETKDFTLKENGCALRIREKNGKYKLTLKEPHPQGLLETHDALTKQEAHSWINGNIVKKEHTTKQLTEKGISPENLIYYGSLTTERREVKYNNVLLVLDYSKYNGHSDYELELEAPTEAIGLEAFNSLLTEHQIHKKETPNKIKRFFSTIEI